MAITAVKLLPNGVISKASILDPLVDDLTSLDSRATSLESRATALEGPPFCEIQSTNVTANLQALPANTPTKVTMVTTVEDNATMADLANSEIVCKKAGLYDLYGQIPFQSNATGSRSASLRHTAAIGGTVTAKAVTTVQANGSDATRLGVFRQGVRLAVNDRIGLYAYAAVAVTLENTANGGALLSAKYVGK